MRPTPRRGAGASEPASSRTSAVSPRDAAPGPRGRAVPRRRRTPANSRRPAPRRGAEAAPASSRTSAVSPRDAASGAPRQGRVATASDAREEPGPPAPRRRAGRAGELSHDAFAARRGVRRPPAGPCRGGVGRPRTAGAAGPATWGGGFCDQLALARALYCCGRRRRGFGNESAVGSIDASTARRDERLRRCHRPSCTWIMRVGARHRTRSASAPRLAGRRPTPLRAQDAAPPSHTLESAFGRARRHSATTEDGRRRRRGDFKLLVCVAGPARWRMHHRLWLPHEA